jgi:hypothetical protein
MFIPSSEMSASAYAAILHSKQIQGILRRKVACHTSPARSQSFAVNASVVGSRVNWGLAEGNRCIEDAVVVTNVDCEILTPTSKDLGAV